MTASKLLGSAPAWLCGDWFLSVQLLNKALLDPGMACFMNRDVIQRFRRFGGVSHTDHVTVTCSDHMTVNFSM